MAVQDSDRLLPEKSDQAGQEGWAPSGAGLDQAGAAGNGPLAELRPAERKDVDPHAAPDLMLDEIKDVQVSTTDLAGRLRPDHVRHGDAAGHGAVQMRSAGQPPPRPVAYSRSWSRQGRGSYQSTSSCEA